MTRHGLRITILCSARLASSAYAQGSFSNRARTTPARTIAPTTTVRPDTATVRPATTAVNPAAAAVSPAAATVSPAPPAISVAEQPTVATTAAARQYSRSVNQVQGELISSGQLHAVVSNNSSVVVSSHSADEHAARKGVFYNFVRAKPEVVALPAPLQTAGGAGETATVLRQELTVPGANGEAVRVQAFVRNGTGLSYVGARNRFEGKFTVALGYADGSPQVPLTQEVSIAVTAPGAESLDPEEMRLKDVDVWHGFGVAVRSPADDYEIEVSAGAKDAGNSVKVPIQRPKVNLAPSVSRVTGFGLGTFDVSVAADGIANPAGAVITFKSDGGAFEGGNTITLGADGTGTLKMRSTSSGVATISALSPFDGSSVKVEFLQPWLILALAGAGGALGAVVTGKRRRWLKGALIGIALAVLYYVGLDWVSKQTGFTSLAHAGEAVSFALGFLGSIVGVGWLGAAKKATGS